jgi:hypothetical protein
MQDHWIDLMKQTRPALAGKNLQAFAYLVKNRLTRPDAIFRRDADAWKIIDDTWAATMARNELPVADAFREAARQIDAAMAGS